jgi:3-dehydroquinate synthase
MVDAAIGGKTGINLGTLKNQVGAFSNPSMIVIDTAYLKTLPARELRSGMSEILKYGLSYDEHLYQLIKAYTKTDFDKLEKLIYRSIEIKNKVVLKDPQEQNLRKVLNFGHSLGHAIESLFLSKSEENHITHGEAVAAGMVLAAHLSHQYLEFSLDKTDEIKCHIQQYFGRIGLSKSDYHSILDLLKHDKKAESGCVKFVLLTQIGRFKLNCNVDETAIIKALDYYNA